VFRLALLGLRAEVGAVDAMSRQWRERDVGVARVPGDAEGVVDGAFDARSGLAVRQLDRAQVDGSEGGLESGFDGVVAVFGGGHAGFVGVPGESGGEVGFPGEFGGVVEEPVAALFDGGFDVGDAGDGSFGVVEAVPAPLELVGGADALVFEVSEVALLGVDAVAAWSGRRNRRRRVRASRSARASVRLWRVLVIMGSSRAMSRSCPATMVRRRGRSPRTRWRRWSSGRRSGPAWVLM
jgi:hypothetical protein